MARLARAVIPGVPHHITQRGNRRQATFFSEDDYRVYLELMAQWCGRFGVEVWAYCLMPNHVHVAGSDDRLVTAAPLLALVGDWRGFLATGATETRSRDSAARNDAGDPWAVRTSSARSSGRSDGRSAAESPGQGGDGPSK